MRTHPALALLALAATACNPASTQKPSSDPTTADTAAPRRDVPTATASASSAASAAVAGGAVAPLDLSSHGLPLLIDVPACAKPSAPQLKVEDNAHDVILLCGTAEDALMNGATFAIQLGPARGKVWKKEIAEEPGFGGFTKEEPDFLEYQENGQNFIMRSKIAGVEYACFSGFPADKQHLAGMIAACRSLRAK